jgi:hypothetical protein
MSPALIFDEFEVKDPFTENSRRGGSNLKIHGLLQAATSFVGMSSKGIRLWRGKHAASV